jgi:predicted transcriptional regulator
MNFSLDKAKKFGLKIPQQEYEEYSQEQLTKGIEVEKEHTEDEEICAIIAAHHLDEISDYYDRLDRMEQEAESKTPKAPKNEDIGSKLDEAFGLAIDFQ